MYQMLSEDLRHSLGVSPKNSGAIRDFVLPVKCIDENGIAYMGMPQFISPGMFFNSFFVFVTVRHVPRWRYLANPSRMAF